MKALGLAAALRTIGHPVTVIGVGSAPGCQGLPQLARFHGTPVPARLNSLARSIRAAQVIHTLGFRDPVGTAAALIARQTRVPYLLEPSGMHRRRLRSLRLKAVFDRLVGARMVAGASVIVATSKLEATELEEDGVMPERIRLRPNGIETEGLMPLPTRGALRRKLNFPPDAPVVLSLGRITAKKGLLDFARALARLTGIRGIVAGPDEGDGTLDRLLSERASLHLTERLAVLPQGLWGSDRAQAFADADAFCLPSATENFGNAALEAAAVGMPVVISDACGAIEWLEPQGTRVVPYADVDLLAEALRDVLENANVRRAAEAAAPRIRAALSWHAVATRQHEIYEELLAHM
ncbi:MAG TPA: glycosyltransferase [Candidatus Dormibacteraeota bacterium]|nr:glycosyltransferase [Candidatus Dormibacteraeota bacterium]